MRKWLTAAMAAMAMLCALCNMAAGQVNYTPAPVATQQFFDGNGVAAALGTLCTYAAGSSTPLATYQDWQSATVNQTCIPLNSGGWTPYGLFLGSSCYKFVLTSAAGSQLWTRDGVCGEVATMARPPATGYGSVTPAPVAATTLSTTGAMTIGGSLSVTGALNAASVNGDLWASASSATDMGAQVAALVSALPTSTTANGPAATGTINIPLNIGASYSFSTPIVINSPLVWIDCHGGSLIYTGASGVGVTINDAPTSYTGNGGIRNCWLQNTQANTTVLKVQEATWFNILHSRLTAAGSGTTCLWMNDVTKWTEQSHFDDVLLDQCAVGAKLTDAGSGGGMGYADWRHVQFSVPAGGTGLLMQNDTFVTGDLDMRFFLAQGATAFSAQGTSAIPLGTRLRITGELTGGATSANGIVTVAGTSIVSIGENHWWNTTGIADSFAANLDGTPTFINYPWCDYSGGSCASTSYAMLSIYKGGPTTYPGSIFVGDITGPLIAKLPPTSGQFVFPGLELTQTWLGTNSFGLHSSWDNGLIYLPSDVRATGNSAGQPWAYLSAHDDSGVNSIGWDFRTQSGGAFVDSLKLNPDGSAAFQSNVAAGAGSNIVYRCATSGALPAGALTITTGSCGTTSDTGLRVK